MKFRSLYAAIAIAGAAAIGMCAHEAAQAQTVTVTGCSSVAANNVAKSTDKVKLAADIACLDRAAPMANSQIATARKVRQDRLDALTRIKTPPIKEPAPTPTPTPTPTPSPIPTPTPTPTPTSSPSGKTVVIVGDSISIDWPGSYSGLFKAAHAELNVNVQATGGDGIDQMTARIDQVLAAKPQFVSLDVGANDLNSTTWLAKVFAYTDRLRAAGIKVALATVMPNCLPEDPTNPAYRPNFPASNAQFVKDRAIVNVAIRLAKGVHYDTLIDFGGDGTLGNDNVCKNAPNFWSADGTHPTAAAQTHMAEIFAAAMMDMVNGVDDGTKAEAPKVASGIKISDFVQPAWGTGELPPPDIGEGAFRFNCFPSHVSYNDPIVYPGQAGKSHLHMFFGNTKADANSTYVSLRTTGDSSCSNILNRSAYWVPGMLDGNGKVHLANYISIYYKNSPKTDPGCSQPFAAMCRELPRGLRMVAGYNMLNPASTPNNPWGNRWFNCDGPGAVSDHFATIAEAAKGCPVGALLGFAVVTPQCWNGKDLDSPDHRSHMAYATGDQYGNPVCPKTHPIKLPFFEIIAWFTTDNSLDRSGTSGIGKNTWFLSCDRMKGMTELEPGTCLHSDWFGAWEDDAKTIWTVKCIDAGKSCSGGVLGDGTQMKAIYPDPQPGTNQYNKAPILVNPPPAPMLGM